MNVDVKIHRIPVGPFTNAFLISGRKATALIDTGFPNQQNRLLRHIQKLGIHPRDIRLIIATHGHADHVGSISGLKTQTPADVLMHAADSDLLRKAIVTIPPAATARGRILHLLLRACAVLGRFDPIEPDLVIEERLSLRTIGIPGWIIPTPGHTPGSLSVVLQNGETLVGDLAVNCLPLGLGLGIPALAENVQEIYGSWERILSAGAKTIYPAHGKPFLSTQLHRLLKQCTS